MRYFGTDGIRGIYGESLTEELAYRAGLGAARLIGGQFVVGMDTRESSESLCEAVTAGLKNGGCDVNKVGIVPTPCVAYLAASHGYGGVMISASHNPPQYNGLKFFAPSGYKLTEEDERRIEYYVDGLSQSDGSGKVREFSRGRDEYIRFLAQCGGDLSGKSVALDCDYGAAITVAREAFERCGARVTAYCDTKEGSKINYGVGSLYPEFISGKTDGLGFAFDGDADRLSVTCGGVVDGDSVLYNLALELGAVDVVGTVMNNAALENAVRARGGRFVRTAVGDRNISEAMRRHGFLLGGEQSGHYIIAPSTSGDGVLTALILSRLDEFIRLELVPQKLASVEGSERVLRCERFVLARRECEKLIGGGRLVVRMSGTEGKIRVMAEGENEDLLSEIISRLTDEIKLCNKELL